jgi:NAD(P)-dependent dehydrogenase (short-subunit alcohol dehydrogenase family)
MAPAPLNILISGASRGIGLAIAKTLRGRGAVVVGTSRTATDKTPGLVTLDVTNDASVSACVADVIAKHGRIDVLIANAGYDLYGALEDTSLAEFADQIDTNLMGVVRMVKTVLPQMRAQGSGRIIVIGSLGGQIGLPMNSAYAASKFALQGFCESLRLELATSGISVAIVTPPAVATDTLATSIRQTTGGPSPLTARTDAMVATMRNEGAASAISPQHVAAVVEKTVFARHLRLNNPVGAQATWLPRLKALVPQRLFEGMLLRRFP